MHNRLLFILFLTVTLVPLGFADDIDSDWYEPGVEITQPNVWGSPGVMVTDTLGRPVPNTASQSCVLVRQCFANGNCVLSQVCS